MPESDWTHIRAALAEPFEDDELKERDGRGGMRFTYADARVYMDRLDDVVGCESWSDSYRVIDAANVAVECTLTVLGVSKTDVGYCNNAEHPEDEAFKSAYSDAFKRACTKFGLGRFLYSLKPGGQRAPEPARQSQPPRRQPTAVVRAAASEFLLCEDCGQPLKETRFKDGTTWSADQLAGFARRKHGRVLDMDCYRAANEARKAAVLETLAP